MFALDVRYLARTLLNPRYDARIKRGVQSVPRFELGLPFVVRTAKNGGRDSFQMSLVSIDIPVLRIADINDRPTLQLLMDNSHSVLRNFNKDEVLLMCGTCHGTHWLTLLDRNTKVPKRSVCARCGGRVPVMSIIQDAGHA
jgi:ribosomal protein S27AE